MTDAPFDMHDPEQLISALRALESELALKNEVIERRNREVAFKQSLIDKLTHENAVLKRLKFAATSEAYTSERKSLIEETIDADLAAVAAEIEATKGGKKAPKDKQTPKREKLPAHLPRREFNHEPESTTVSGNPITPTWGCGRKLGLVKQRFPGSCDARRGCDSRVNS